MDLNLTGRRDRKSRGRGVTSGRGRRCCSTGMNHQHLTNSVKRESHWLSLEKPGSLVSKSSTSSVASSKSSLLTAVSQIPISSTATLNRVECSSPSRNHQTCDRQRGRRDGGKSQADSASKSLSKSPSSFKRLTTRGSYYYIVSIVFFVFFVSLFDAGQGIKGCNEAVCASIVSKCTLLKSCDCEIEPTSCSCCKKCFACLEHLQADCCACVGLCPAQDDAGTAALQKSVVSDFPTSVPQLWEALTDGNDEQERWHKVTYPIDILKATFKAEEAKKKVTEAKNEGGRKENIVTIQEKVLPDPLMTVNCTVAYLRQCMAEKKCEMSCQSMGASAYRWFQDGCCECVGNHCINYGISESRCAECSDEEDDVPEEISDEELERLEQEYAEELEALDGASSY